MWVKQNLLYGGGYWAMLRFFLRSKYKVIAFNYANLEYPARVSERANILYFGGGMFRVSRAGVSEGSEQPCVCNFLKSSEWFSNSIGAKVRGDFGFHYFNSGRFTPACRQARFYFSGGSCVFDLIYFLSSLFIYPKRGLWKMANSCSVQNH